MTALKHGHATRIDLTSSGTTMWEKEVTPPGIQGGGAISTHTFHNTTWRTKAPKALKDLSEASLSVAYDPAHFTGILTDVQVNQEIEITFNNGDKYKFWGFVDTFVPGGMNDENQPMATVTIIPTLVDNSDVEQDPVFTPAP